MIKLILIIIIIFFLSKIIIKEHFDSDIQDDDDNFVNDNECNFYPYGNNESDCITKCRYSELKTNYDLYNKCNESKCKEKCVECKNEELCPWTHSSDVDSNSDVSNNIVENIILEKTASDENNQIKINWSLTPLTPPDKYLIYYKNQKNKAINVIELSTPPAITSPTSTSTSTSSDSEEKIFNIVDLDKYQFNENLIKGNKYEFIIYGIYDDHNNTIKSNKLLVYT